jgi:hypothetical protein
MALTGLATSLSLPLPTSGHKPKVNGVSGSHDSENRRKTSLTSKRVQIVAMPCDEVSADIPLETSGARRTSHRDMSS